PDVTTPAVFTFLPAGNTITFQNGTNPLTGALNPDFAILNRIQTNVPSRFDGHIVSQLRDASGTLSRGGTVLFSSPGGIIVGATAVFDVGNLVLTTLDMATEDGYGNFTPGNY